MRVAPPPALSCLYLSTFSLAPTNPELRIDYNDADLHMQCSKFIYRYITNLYQ